MNGFRLLGMLLLPSLVWAIDIDPSKKTNNNTGGGKNRFDIFSGDPARIQKANSINFSDLKSTLEIGQPEFSLYSIKEEGLRPNLRVTFKVKNTNPKRTYTLSFPNAKRYEFIVRAPNGQIAFKWSADKIFMETIGTTLINPTDVLGYTELIPVADFYTPLSLGEYTVEASLANYPEVVARGTFKVVPTLTPPATASAPGTEATKVASSPVMEPGAIGLREPELPKKEEEKPSGSASPSDASPGRGPGSATP